jgi:AAHS family 4-hydroxybenzoate transporter-like MFS transporter
VKRIAIPLFGFVVIMLDGFDLQSIGFVAPELAKKWSVSLAAFAPAFSAGLFGTILGALLAGTGRRYFGQRLALALAILIFGAGSLSIAWVEGLGALIALRFIVGLGLGCALPLVMTLVAENAPDRFRAALVTLALCGQPTGAILGAVLCGRLIPAYGWRSAFVLGGGLPLIVLPVIFALTRSRSASAAPRDISIPELPGKLRDILTTALLPTSLLMWATAFLSGFMVYVVINWLPGVLREQGYSLQASLLALSLFNVGGMVGGIGISALVDRFGSFKVVPGAYLIAALSLGAQSLVIASLQAFDVSTILSGISGSGASICLGSVAILIYPSSLRTIGVGCVVAIARLGAATGPLVIGVALGLGMMASRLFYFAAFAAAIAGLCFFALGKARQIAA